MIILFKSTYDVIRTPTNGSSVYWSLDTYRDTLPVYCTLIGGSSAAYTNSDFLTPISFEPYVVNLWSNRSHSLKCQMSITLDCKDIGIRKSEFVTKTQFLWHSFISIYRDRNIRYNLHGSQTRAKVNSFQPIPPFIFPL